MNIRESFYLDVKTEFNSHITDEEASYNYIVDTLDTLYRNKDKDDNSLNLWDIKTIMAILDDDTICIERAYYDILEYLED